MLTNRYRLARPKAHLYDQRATGAQSKVVIRDKKQKQILISLLDSAITLDDDLEVVIVFTTSQFTSDFTLQPHAFGHLQQRNLDCS